MKVDLNWVTNFNEEVGLDIVSIEKDEDGYYNFYIANYNECFQHYSTSKNPNLLYFLRKYGPLNDSETLKFLVKMTCKGKNFEHLLLLFIYKNLFCLMNYSTSKFEIFEIGSRQYSIMTF